MSADTRLLNRMRCSAVSAVYGAGMHPNSSLWVSNPKRARSFPFRAREHPQAIVKMVYKNLLERQDLSSHRIGV